MQEQPYTVKSSAMLYQGPAVSVREDTLVWPSGQTVHRDVIEMNDTVTVIALNEKNELCLVNVYRHAQDEWAWELPTGGSVVQGPIHTAMHELAEQTGLVASEYVHIGSLRLGGTLSQKIQVVVMRRLQQTDEDKKRERGIAEARFQPLEAIEVSIALGDINDVQTIASVMMYKNWMSQAAGQPPAPAS